MWKLFTAVIPAVVLIAYILYRDKYERETLKPVFISFFAGMLAVPIDLLLIDLLNLEILPFYFSGALPEVADAFVLAAIPEELSKLVILFIVIWKNKNFNERMDGIVYAVCVSMGFATIENVMYVFEDPSCALGRAIFAVPGHFLFAVLMGFFLSMVKFTVKHRFRNIVLTLLAPVLAHGIYDSILMVSDVLSPFWQSALMIMFYVFIFLLWRICLRRIKEHVESSPFAYWRRFNQEDRSNIDDIYEDNRIDNMKDFFDR